MNPAFQKDDALLDDIRTADPGGGGFCLWWLGQSGFLVKWRGDSLLFDPYLSDSLTEKYAATDKPHVRVTERVIDPARLAGIVAAATSSHNHTDHLDAATLRPLTAANPGMKLLLPAANLAFARERLGGGAPEMVGLSDDGIAAQVGPFSVKAVASAHNAVDRDESGRPHYIGFVARFGPWAIYHSGDTLWHAGLVPALLPERIDLMLLPINGNKPERRVAGNLNGTEAAALAKACGARLAIPCHYDMFAFNTEPPDEFAAACARLGQGCAVLRNGERWDSVSLGG